MHIVALNCNISLLFSLYFHSTSILFLLKSVIIILVFPILASPIIMLIFITPKKILNYLISTVGRVHKGIPFKFQSQLSFRCATERCRSIRRQLYVTSALLVLISIGTNCLLLIETAVVRTIIKLNHPLRSPIPIMDHNLK